MIFFFILIKIVNYVDKVFCELQGSPHFILFYEVDNFTIVIYFHLSIHVPFFL